MFSVAPPARTCGHGGADFFLMNSFTKAVANNQPSLIKSGPSSSLASHLMVFSAENSRLSNKVVQSPSCASRGTCFRCPRCPHPFCLAIDFASGVKSLNISLKLGHLFACHSNHHRSGDGHGYILCESSVNSLFVLCESSMGSSVPL